jgi:hypothetical protein
MGSTGSAPFLTSRRNNEHKYRGTLDVMTKDYYPKDASIRKVRDLQSNLAETLQVTRVKSGASKSE